MAITLSLTPSLNPGLTELAPVMYALYKLTRDAVSSRPRYVYGSVKASGPNLTTVLPAWKHEMERQLL